MMRPLPRGCRFRRHLGGGAPDTSGRVTVEAVAAPGSGRHRHRGFCSGELIPPARPSLPSPCRVDSTIPDFRSRYPALHGLRGYVNHSVPTLVPCGFPRQSSAGEGTKDAFCRTPCQNTKREHVVARGRSRGCMEQLFCSSPIRGLLSRGGYRLGFRRTRTGRAAPRGRRRGTSPGRGCRP